MKALGNLQWLHEVYIRQSGVNCKQFFLLFLTESEKPAAVIVNFIWLQICLFKQLQSDLYTVSARPSS